MRGRFSSPAFDQRLPDSKYRINDGRIVSLALKLPLAEV